MSRHDEEWIPVSDLMAGFASVVVVMFVLASAEGARAMWERIEQREQSELTISKLRETRSRHAAARQRVIDEVFDAIESDIRAQGLGEEVAVDRGARTVRLRDATFTRGSACVARSAEAALRRWSPRFRALLTQRDDVTLDIEGHTDSRPLREREGDISDVRAHRCALFDDNYTLSAARAREARRVITNSDTESPWPVGLSTRVAVVGYGDSRPRQGMTPDNAENRRVEIHVQVPPDEPISEQGATLR